MQVGSHYSEHLSAYHISVLSTFVRAYAGDKSQQQQLLQVKDHQGNTALHLAAMEGLAECVQLLLQAGAPVNLPGQCFAPQT